MTHLLLVPLTAFTQILFFFPRLFRFELKDSTEQADRRTDGQTDEHNPYYGVFERLHNKTFAQIYCLFRAVDFPVTGCGR